MYVLTISGCSSSMVRNFVMHKELYQCKYINQKNLYL